MKKAAVYFFAISLVGLPARAEDFQGADVVLKRLAERAKAKPKTDEKTDPIEELAKKVGAFSKDGQNLPAEAAAAQWLALYDTFVSIPQEALYRRSGYDRLSMQEIIKALPPSAAWPALTETINKRTEQGKALRDSGLRLFASVLQGDGAVRRKAVEALKQAIGKDKDAEDGERERLTEAVEQLADILDQFSGNDAERVATFEKRLAQAEKVGGNKQYSYNAGLQVPDLVRMAGTDRAGTLLLRALQVGGDSLSIEGKSTRRLAANIALKNINKLRQPYWELVQSMEDLALYEALAHKFPKPGDQWRKAAADQVYLLGLIATDRTKEASKFVIDVLARGGENPVNLSVHGMEHMQEQGMGKRLLTFLHDMIKGKSSLSLWSSYIELAAREGASAEALALLEESLVKPVSDPKQKLELQVHYANALLAADQVDKGIEVLREIVKAGPQSGTVDGEAKAAEVKKQWSQLGLHITPEMLRSLKAQNVGRTDSGRGQHLGLCRRLGKLGVLLQRPDLVDEAVRAAIADCTAIPREEELNSNRDVLSTAEMLLDLKHLPEAEALLVNDLLVFAAPPKEGENRRHESAAEALGMLAMIYFEAGRAADVIKLLDQSPQWPTSDLSALSAIVTGETPLALTAARALAQVNRKDEARKIALRLVQDYPGKDSCYHLLLSLGTEGLEKQMDEIYKGDRFQERPLIWKAKLQFLAGRFDEAEKTVRAAIAVDPSDGEQGKGDRMRAYAVLGDILEKKGDVDQAKIMHGAVSAIRIAENADDWWNAGLLSRAVKMYEEALKQFADAYCIQSRLALRYSEMGDSEKAEQYYRRAFELMPESFGRVESHCFGCEGAFAGEHAQGIAERVFTQLATKFPDRSQIYYLLGYLREAEGRAEDAAIQFGKAVKLDPDYLNAWNRLQGLENDVNRSAEERERIELELFRIDPLGHHSQPSLDKLSSLGKIWDAILAAERSRPERLTGPLYPLAAAAAEMDKVAAIQGQRFSAREDFFDRQEELRARFVSHPLVSLVSQYLQMVSRTR